MDEPEPNVQMKRLRDVLRHIKNVQANTEILAFKMAEEGDVDFARKLIAAGFMHDNSKFFGIEWDFLHRDTNEDSREFARIQHVENNEHHTEFWGGIDQMPDVRLAELVCDLKARSSEMGTDLREYYAETFMAKNDIKKNSKVDRRIRFFLARLLDEPFK